MIFNWHLPVEFNDEEVGGGVGVVVYRNHQRLFLQLISLSGRVEIKKRDFKS